VFVRRCEVVTFNLLFKNCFYSCALNAVCKYSATINYAVKVLQLNAKKVNFGG
jgi:hypothetical protein